MQVGRSAERHSSPSRGKIDDMASTLQLDLGAVRDIAWTVAEVAGLIAMHSFHLRLPIGSPATDFTSRYLADRVNRESVQLAHTADGAADELTRAMEALLAYVNNAAMLARQTELAAVMGLEIDAPAPAFAVSAPRPPRDASSGGPGPALPDRDHSALSEAVLLSEGVQAIAHRVLNVAQVRAAAATLNDCARRLRAAVTGGERPARTLERFGSWVERDFAAALTERENSIVRWSDEYLRARARVEPLATRYRRWLIAAAASADQDALDLRAAAAQARAVMREYGRTPVGGLNCAPHPRLGGS